jgi:hypothetical protein
MMPIIKAIFDNTLSVPDRLLAMAWQLLKILLECFCQDKASLQTSRLHLWVVQAAQKQGQPFLSLLGAGLDLL